MSEKPKLKLDWCSHKAAKYACEHWHYSKCMPVGKLVKIGVWEDDVFIGVVLFGRGASMYLGRSFNLKQNQICELTRIALKGHISNVTKISSIAISMLKNISSKTELIFSFADSRQKHLGIIYQAGNWIYTGKSPSDKQYLINGKWTHPRSVGAKFGTRKTEFIEKMGFETRIGMPKHRYLYPLNKKIRKQIKLLAKPYPKKINADAHKRDFSDQEDKGGANPTHPLHLKVSNG